MHKHLPLLLALVIPVCLTAQTYQLNYQVVQQLSDNDIALTYTATIFINEKNYLYLLRPTNELLQTELRKQSDDGSMIVYYPNPDSIPRIVYRSFDSSVVRYKISNSPDDIEYYIQKYSPNRMIIQPVNEDRKINGFSCKKALIYTAVQKSSPVAEVWYCPEIPIKTGPAELDGIPGLTIEATNYQTAEQFKLLSTTKLNQDEPIVFWHPEFNSVRFKLIGN